MFSSGCALNPPVRVITSVLRELPVALIALGPWLCVAVDVGAPKSQPATPPPIIPSSIAATLADQFVASQKSKSPRPVPSNPPVTTPRSIQSTCDVDGLNLDAVANDTVVPSAAPIPAKIPSPSLCAAIPVSPPSTAPQTLADPTNAELPGRACVSAPSPSPTPAPSTPPTTVAVAIPFASHPSERTPCNPSAAPPIVPATIPAVNAAPNPGLGLLRSTNHAPTAPSPAPANGAHTANRGSSSPAITSAHPPSPAPSAIAPA